MFVKALRGGGVALGLGLALASLVIAPGNTASAQSAYVTDYICFQCHTSQWLDNRQHGHSWMSVHTGGQVPPANLFATIGEPLPPLPVVGGTAITWDKVEDIVANFEGEGSFLMKDGSLVEPDGRVVKPMPARCNKCHTTGFTDPGADTSTPAIHAYGNVNIKGNWQVGSSALNELSTQSVGGQWGRNGIQCEQCHGAGPAMIKSPEMNSPDKGLCRDCHSSGDATFRVAFSPATNLFSNHHPQGDEYRVSPHKNNGCTSCHDPHKSVWHDQGGVLWAEQYADPGNMCMKCHTERVRGAMGQIGLVCADCHMPEVSAGATRASHIFKLTDQPLVATQNLFTSTSSSGATSYWWNKDANGNSFLTLDLVCASCHGNMNIKNMANAAPYIHRAFGMVDLTVNGNDTLSNTTKTAPVSVKFSILAGAKKGMPANIFVMSQGPKGWTSWNGSKWVRGQVPFRKNAALADIPQTTVYSGKLTAGKYTYWVAVYPSDGSSTTGAVPISVR